VFGRWLLVPHSNAARARIMALLGVALLVAFIVLRGIDGYGNWGLHRDSLDVLQWLHVNKYPPSITYTTLELGIAFLLFSGLTALDDPDKPRRALAPLALFGAAAFFYYLWHVHLMLLASKILDLDPRSDGLLKTWVAAALVLAVLAGPTWLYRRYKRAHPDSWTRYI
jgi:peptidoglycan/LPS O-acetylase OafA/YrhL